MNPVIKVLQKKVIQRKCLFIIFLIPILFLIYALLATMIIILKDILPFQGLIDIATKILLLLLLAGHVFFLCWILRSLVWTKYYASMQVVNKFLSYNEAKELLMKEHFIERYIELSGKKILVYNSNNWICIDGILIPKKMILGIVPKYNTNYLTTQSNYYLVTVNNRLICCGIWKTKEEEELQMKWNQMISGLEIAGRLRSVYYRGYNKLLQAWYATSSFNEKDKALKFIYGENHNIEIPDVYEFEIE